MLGFQRTAADESGLRGARRFVIVGNTEVGIGGDLIMELDGQKVDRNDALARALSKKRPSDSMNVTIYRDGKRSTVKVTLGERPEERF